VQYLARNTACNHLQNGGFSQSRCGTPSADPIPLPPPLVGLGAGPSPPPLSPAQKAGLGLLPNGRHRLHHPRSQQPPTRHLRQRRPPTPAGPPWQPPLGAPAPVVPTTPSSGLALVHFPPPLRCLGWRTPPWARLEGTRGGTGALPGLNTSQGVAPPAGLQRMVLGRGGDKIQRPPRPPHYPLLPPDPSSAEAAAWVRPWVCPAVTPAAAAVGAAAGAAARAGADGEGAIEAVLLLVMVLLLLLRCVLLLLRCVLLLLLRLPPVELGKRENGSSAWIPTGAPPGWTHVGPTSSTTPMRQLALPLPPVHPRQGAQRRTVRRSAATPHPPFSLPRGSLWGAVTGACGGQGGLPAPPLGTCSGTMGAPRLLTATGSLRATVS